MDPLPSIILKTRALFGVNARCDVLVYLALNGAGHPREIEPGEGSEGVVSFHMERNDGFFNRTIALPRDVDTSKAESVLSNGILTITLHKKKIAETKQISVKEG